MSVDDSDDDLGPGPRQVRDNGPRERSTWEAAVEAIPVSIYVRDRAGRFVRVNARSAAFIGRDPADLIGKTLHDVVPAEQADSLVAGDKEVLDSGEEFVIESPILRADGSNAMVLTVKCPLLDESGNVVGTVAYGRDVSELWEVREALREQVEINRSYQTAVESLPDPIYAKDVRGNRIVENHPCKALVDLIADLDVDRRHRLATELQRIEAEAISGGSPVIEELLLPTADHSFRYHSATAAPIRDGGRIVGVTVALRDIQAMKTVERQLRSEADLDPLTGMRNRRSTLRAMEGIATQSADLALIMFDLDRFKQINDLHGHSVGDQVLVAVAEAVERTLRPTDVLGRWGGEEFMVATAASANVAARIASRVHHIVSTVAIELVTGAPVTVSASVGWAIQEPGELIDQLIDRADAALYRAKHAGRDRVST